MVGILTKIAPSSSKKKLKLITLLMVFLSCLSIAYLNPNILDIISNIIGPFLIILLFFIPIYSIYVFTQMNKYKSILIDSIIVLIGVVIIIIILYQYISLEQFKAV